MLITYSLTDFCHSFRLGTILKGCKVTNSCQCPHRACEKKPLCNTKSVLERSQGPKINIFEDIAQNLFSGTPLFLQFSVVNEKTINFRALKYVLK